MTIELPQFVDGDLLSHTACKTWNACRFRYFIAYVLGIRRAHQSEPLRMGSLWHVGVGAYEGGMPIADVEAMLRQAYADQDCPPYLTADEYAVEQEKVVAMVKSHHARWKEDAILESLAIEQPFAVPILNPETGRPTPSYLDAGMIDRVARLPDGTVAIVERKTTSEAIDPVSPYWMALRNDPQISRYLRAARTMGHNATKIVYDVIRKPAIRPRKTEKAEQAIAARDGLYYGLKVSHPMPDRETPAMYGARLLADLIARPDFYFARNEIARLDGDLEEFAQDLWDTQKDIAQAKLTGRYTRNASSCLEPYQCEFLDVCHEIKQDPSRVPAGFRRKTRLHEEIPLPALATV